MDDWNFQWKTTLICLGEAKLLQDILAKGWPDSIKSIAKQFPTSVLPLTQAEKKNSLYKIAAESSFLDRMDKTTLYVFDPPFDNICSVHSPDFIQHYGGGQVFGGDLGPALTLFFPQHA